MIRCASEKKETRLKMQNRLLQIIAWYLFSVVFATEVTLRMRVFEKTIL